MMQTQAPTATVTWFNDMKPYEITGKIVATIANTTTIEDTRGIRYSAHNSRVKYPHTPSATDTQSDIF